MRAELLSIVTAQGKATPEVIQVTSEEDVFLCRGFPVMPELDEGCFTRMVGIRSERWKSISRKHAKISSSRTGFCIMDLNSNNGVYVNMARLSPNTKYKLQHGDRVDLGDPMTKACAASFIFCETSNVSSQAIMDRKTEMEILAVKVSHILGRHCETHINTALECMRSDLSGHMDTLSKVVQQKISRAAVRRMQKSEPCPNCSCKASETSFLDEDLDPTCSLDTSNLSCDLGFESQDVYANQTTLQNARKCQSNTILSLQVGGSPNLKSCNNENSELEMDSSESEDESSDDGSSEGQTSSSSSESSEEEEEEEEVVSLAFRRSILESQEKNQSQHQEIGSAEIESQKSEKLEEEMEEEDAGAHETQSSQESNSSQKIVEGSQQDSRVEESQQESRVEESQQDSLVEDSLQKHLSKEEQSQAQREEEEEEEEEVTNQGQSQHEKFHAPEKKFGQQIGENEGIENELIPQKLSQEATAEEESKEMENFNENGTSTEVNATRSLQENDHPHSSVGQHRERNNLRKTHDESEEEELPYTQMHHGEESSQDSVGDSSQVQLSNGEEIFPKPASNCNSKPESDLGADEEFESKEDTDPPGKNHLRAAFSATSLKRKFHSIFHFHKHGPEDDNLSPRKRAIRIPGTAPSSQPVLP